MANRAQQIKYITIHCQAGHGTLESMQEFWKKNLGWNSPGYNTWIDYATNGVAGFNSQCLHISYRGGVLKNDNNKSSDTRTQAQKNSIIKEILKMLSWLKSSGNDLQNVMIVGHYHFSTDQNKNGAIESWERIKECPSFDAYSEYAHLMETHNSNYHKLKLPKNR
jgi:N-acetylmuramoyl-L-alanine amidase